MDGARGFMQTINQECLRTSSSSLTECVRWQNALLQNRNRPATIAPGFASILHGQCSIGPMSGHRRDLGLAPHMSGPRMFGQNVRRRLLASLKRRVRARRVPRVSPQVSVLEARILPTAQLIKELGLSGSG